MKKYSETIAETRLIREVRSCTTTGDTEYIGSALEIADEKGVELFHVVVDANGERQVLFFPSGTGFRIPVDVLERIIQKAKVVVRSVDEGT